MVSDFAVIGGGIVGLATAHALTLRFPGKSVLVLEKESSWGRHQTGHNSGVIHSGIYYKPGSLKATLAREGNRTMVAFCAEHGIPHEVCGKLIVATEPHEMPLLDDLFARGQANELSVRRLTPDESREFEPHARCLGAIYVPSTGIADYKRVCEVLAALVAHAGGTLTLNARVTGLHETEAGWRIETGSANTFEARFLVGCAGLQSDRVALMAGVDPGARIVPFRGEYFTLRPEKQYLVRNLIYPVPRPDLPFLGVHLTRMIDGSIHAGPNAVLGLKREGYRKTDISLRDVAETLSYPGLWRMARRYAGEGAREAVRSLSKSLFAHSLQRLVPEIEADDLVPAEAGVRAQALRPDGALVDDFLLVPGRRALHVCNAPSPAATAALEIGRAVTEKVADALV